MSHMRSGDAGIGAEKFNLGFEMGPLTWMVGTSVWMVVLQGLLLIIHRSRTSQSRNGQPSRVEICVAVILFWAFQIGAGQMLTAIWSILSFVFSDFETTGRNGEGNHLDVRTWVVGMGLRWVWAGVGLLFRRVLTTYYFHLGIIFLLDTGIPFWREIRHNPNKALQKLELRSREILNFLDSTFQDPFSDFSLLPRANSEEILKRSDQTLHLERRQTDHPSEGQRTLSWNIAVDKDALDEMKETLGPPGGFGELGFNVARDGVRFEAMGIGTSFSLMFKLREIAKNGKVKEIRIKKYK